MTKPAPGEMSDIQQRNLPLFTLLIVLTLGLYWLYVVYQWSKEMNGLVGRVKYPPLALLVINLLTLGLAGLAYECIWTYDVAQAVQKRNPAGQAPNLPLWVIVLNSAGLLLSLTGVGVIVGFPLGIAASILLQRELNKLASDVPVLKESPVETSVA